MHARTAARRRAVAGLGALALGLTTALVTTAPAQAADAREVVEESGDIAWGFRENFRRYVGLQTAALPPIGAVPVGERIVLVAPAEFDLDGTPAATVDTTPPNETLPYLLPVTGGSYVDEENVRVESAGGATFRFPSHAFTVTVENVGIQVTDGVGEVVGDLTVEIPENALGYPEGVHGGTDVVLGRAASTTVALDGDTLTVSAGGVTLTQAGADALQNFLQEGADLDALTLSAELGAAGGGEPVGDPKLALSKSSVAAGETITVTGTGFDPLANTSTRPPVTVGQPSGVYVIFGKFADDWRPSAGAASSARTVISQKWALPEPSFTQVGTGFPSQAPQLVELAADGSFTLELTVDTLEDVEGNYGVYTYAGGGAGANAAQELYAPVRFATDGDIELEVTVPEGDGGTDPEEPGEFVWTIGGGAGAVSLGTAEVENGAFVADGALKQVTVTDTRAGQPAWTINGSVSDFVAGDRTFEGKYLGWAPSVGANTVGAVAGAAVVPGAGAGLSAASTLASAPVGHAKGSATIDATLSLELPLETEAGDYTGVLTLTAVG